MKAMQALGAAAPNWVKDLADSPRVYDNVLADPDAFRHAVLNAPAQSVEVATGQTFHGIHVPTADQIEVLVHMLAAYVPDGQLQLTFARQSPQGQEEPNYIHSDINESDTTAILYLNPEPAEGDGTTFWQRKANGLVRGPWDEATYQDSHDPSAWTPWRTVEARYNRLLVFRGDYYHSRALISNYGEGDDARLIQVLFLTDRPKVA